MMSLQEKNGNDKNISLINQKPKFSFDILQIPTLLEENIINLEKQIPEEHNIDSILHKYKLLENFLMLNKTIIESANQKINNTLNDIINKKMLL